MLVEGLGGRRRTHHVERLFRAEVLRILLENARSMPKARSRILTMGAACGTIHLRYFHPRGFNRDTPMIEHPDYESVQPRCFSEGPVEPE